MLYLLPPNSDDPALVQTDFEFADFECDGFRPREMSRHFGRRRHLYGELIRFGLRGRRGGVEGGCSDIIALALVMTFPAFSCQDIAASVALFE